MIERLSHLSQACVTWLQVSTLPGSCVGWVWTHAWVPLPI